MKFCEILKYSWKVRIFIHAFRSPFSHVCNLCFAGVRISSSQLKTLFPSTVKRYELFFCTQAKFCISVFYFMGESDSAFSGDVNFMWVPKNARGPEYFFVSTDIPLLRVLKKIELMLLFQQMVDNLKRGNAILQWTRKLEASLYVERFVNCSR